MHSNRLLYIDGLKGISAIIVVLHHLLLFYRYEYPYLDNLNDIPFINLLVNGNYAVFIFVTISSLILGNKINKDLCFNHLQTIILKRYFRLMLPICIILIGMTIMKMGRLFYCYEYAELYNINIIPTFNYLDLPKAIIMSPLGRSYNWLEVTWMLNYILFGTFICIILSISLRNINFKKKCILLLGTTLILYVYDTLYASIIVGYLLGLLTSRINSGQLKNIIATTSLISIILIEIIDPNINLNFFLAIFTITLCYSSFLHKILSFSFFTYLGKMSLYIYLTHMPIIYSFSSYLSLNTDISLTTIVFSSILFIIITSFMFYHFVDSHINSLTNKIVKAIIK